MPIAMEQNRPANLPTPCRSESDAGMTGLRQIKKPGLFFRLGSLTGKQVVDFQGNRNFIHPKSSVSKVIFGCLIVVLQALGQNLHTLSLETDKGGLKNMVKSEAQTCCRLQAHYSTYHSRLFQVPMTSGGLRTNAPRTTRSS